MRDLAVQIADDAQKPVHVIPERDFIAALGHGRTNIWPEHWPQNVRVISLDGLSVLGLDGEGTLYLNGKRLYTERRLARQERVIAWIVAGASMGAMIAASASAYADLFLS